MTASDLPLPLQCPPDQDLWQLELQAYEIFTTEVVDAPLTYEGLPILVRDNGICNQHGTTFHHIYHGTYDGLVSDSHDRLAHIPWIAPMLLACASHSSAPCVWEEVKQTRRGRKQRVCVSLTDYSHLIVLEHSKMGYWLITAFPARYPHYRKRLKTSHEAWQKLRGRW